MNRLLAILVTILFLVIGITGCDKEVTKDDSEIQPVKQGVITVPVSELYQIEGFYETSSTGGNCNKVRITKLVKMPSGKTEVLAYESGPFRKNTIEVLFDEYGNVEKYHIKSEGNLLESIVEVIGPLLPNPFTYSDEMSDTALLPPCDSGEVWDFANRKRLDIIPSEDPISQAEIADRIQLGTMSPEERILRMLEEVEEVDPGTSPDMDN